MASGSQTEERGDGQGERLDIILAGGTVVDRAQGLEAPMEVGIRGRRIAAVAEKLPRNRKTRVVDCTGLYVVPGLIDLHVHIYPGLTHLSLDPDDIMMSSGTTTMLDAGSAGEATWLGMQQDVFPRARAHVLALVHICSTGLAGSRLGELRSPHLSDPEAAVKVIQSDPTRAVGIKIRAGTHIIGEGEQGWAHVRQAVEAARASDTFLMVHIGNTPMSIPELAAELAPGDIITHCFKGGPYHHRVVDTDGKVFPELIAAADKGIVFDVGHGAGSFDWDVAQQAFDQGLPPTTISTDLHNGCIDGPVYDLPLTMTKMMELGLSLRDVVAMSTLVPAQVLGLEDEIGTLSPGSTADVTLLRSEEGDFDLYDSYRKVRKAKRALRAAGVVRDGEVLWDPVSGPVVRARR